MCTPVSGPNTESFMMGPDIDTAVWKVARFNSPDKCWCLFGEVDFFEPQKLRRPQESSEL